MSPAPATDDWASEIVQPETDALAMGQAQYEAGQYEAAIANELGLRDRAPAAWGVSQTRTQCFSSGLRSNACGVIP